MSSVQQIIEQLQQLSCPQRAEITRTFFKTNRHQYAEHDQFIGIRVPQLRTLAKQHLTLSVEDTISLLNSPIHEQRHLALFIWVYQYQQKSTSPETKQQIYNAYIANHRQVNNWDLVDTSTPHIMGEHLRTHPRDILYEWAVDDNLWKRRMSIVATWTFIKHQDIPDTFSIAQILLEDPEDLIHKAVGWMLREAGRRDVNALYKFLDKHCTTMPRTMLRYSIEKLSGDKKYHYMSQ